ncbi:hypothetical protein H2P46_14460 [Mixta sp. Marseille-Q2057]|nr:hypothetical protein [Mixta mediterraneensis]
MLFDIEMELTLQLLFRFIKQQNQRTVAPLLPLSKVHELNFQWHWQCFTRDDTPQPIQIADTPIVYGKAFAELAKKMGLINDFIEVKTLDFHVNSSHLPALGDILRRPLM